MGILDNVIGSAASSIESAAQGRLMQGINQKLQGSPPNVPKCPKCKTLIYDPTLKFCPKCGASLARVCTKCNKDIPLGAKFCTQCGSPVEQKN